METLTAAAALIPLKLDLGTERCWNSEDVRVSFPFVARFRARVLSRVQNAKEIPL